MDEDLKKNIMHSGTSLVGIVCKDGVVMAGDKKVTLGGQIVSDKDFAKVHMLNKFAIISWTGAVSDAQLLTKQLTAEIRLKELKDKKRITVKEIASLIAMITYRNARQMPFMVGTMLGGVNEEGTTELYSIGPDGSLKQVKDYDANMSSGMPYILGLLERQYKKGLNVEEGAKLAIEAIKSSSERDTASGFGVDVFEITKDGIKQVSNLKAEAVYTER
jgi:proteasome beta subunit